MRRGLRKGVVVPFEVREPENQCKNEKQQDGIHCERTLGSLYKNGVKHETPIRGNTRSFIVNYEVNDQQDFANMTSKVGVTPSSNVISNAAHVESAACLREQEQDQQRELVLGDEPDGSYFPGNTPSDMGSVGKNNGDGFPATPPDALPDTVTAVGDSDGSHRLFIPGGDPHSGSFTNGLPHRTSIPLEPTENERAVAPSAVASSGEPSSVGTTSSTASSLGNPPTSIHGTAGRGEAHQRHHATKAPVLYSAIGSLESPSAHSESFWNHRQQVRPKYDFPSLQLLPPGNSMQRKIVQANNTGNSSSSSSSNVDKAGEFRKQTHEINASQANAQPEYKPSSLSVKLSAIDSKPTTTDNSSRRSSTSGITSAIANSTKSSESEYEAAPGKTPKPSSLKNSRDGKKNTNTKDGKEGQLKKKVTLVVDQKNGGKPKSQTRRKKSTHKKPEEMFRPSSDAYTPRMGKKEIKYKPAEMRTPVQHMASPLGTLSRPNFRDALRRVAMIIHKHIVKIESRFENKHGNLKDDGLFSESMMREFSEDMFVTPKYKCTMVRVPMARPGMAFGLKLIRQHYDIPTEDEIYEFAHQLFDKVQLSSECSIVCLIYVERLMEVAKVPLLACTWRPIFMCGLLLASKVWQDLSSWNIEFASVYPQYSLDSINRLELKVLKCVKWDLYISSSLYAKYYFALRSLVEKTDFRQRYNRMVGGVNHVQASEALKVQKRSTLVKEEALSQLSRSM